MIIFKLILTVSYQILYKIKQLLSKKYFVQIYGLESDKMTILWPNDNLLINFNIVISNPT